MMTRQAFSSLRIRANFLLSLAAFLGSQPPVVTREQIVAWQANCTNKQGHRNAIPGTQNPSLPANTRGDLGKVLQWPSWLTNLKNYSAGRGKYNVPWHLIDEYNNEVARRENEAAAARQAAAAHAANVRNSMAVNPVPTNAPAATSTVEANV